MTNELPHIVFARLRVKITRAATFIYVRLSWVQPSVSINTRLERPRAPL